MEFDNLPNDVLLIILQIFIDSDDQITFGRLRVNSKRLYELSKTIKISHPVTIYDYVQCINNRLLLSLRSHIPPKHITENFIDPCIVIALARSQSPNITKWFSRYTQYQYSWADLGLVAYLYDNRDAIKGLELIDKHGVEELVVRLIYDQYQKLPNRSGVVICPRRVMVDIIRSATSFNHYLHEGDFEGCPRISE